MRQGLWGRPISLFPKTKKLALVGEEDDEEFHINPAVVDLEIALKCLKCGV
jgi:hypothetical protein